MHVGAETSKFSAEMVRQWSSAETSGTQKFVWDENSRPEVNTLFLSKQV